MANFAQSGIVIFTVTNKGTAVNEFEILAEDKLQIKTERENITPGTTVTVTAQLEPGTLKFMQAVHRRGDCNAIREHKRASIFIATAIVLLIIFVVSAVLGKTGVGPGKLFMSASEKIQKPASSAGRSVSDSARGIFKYRWVVKENNELKKEIRILKNDFVKEKLKKKELEELRELSKKIGRAHV